MHSKRRSNAVEPEANTANFNSILMASSGGRKLDAAAPISSESVAPYCSIRYCGRYDIWYMIWAWLQICSYLFIRPTETPTTCLIVEVHDIGSLKLALIISLDSSANDDLSSKFVESLSWTLTCCDTESENLNSSLADVSETSRVNHKTGFTLLSFLFYIVSLMC